MEVGARRGPVLSRLPPAAVAARFTTCQTVADVVLSAFAQAVPERVVAHCHGGTAALHSPPPPPPGRVFPGSPGAPGGGRARPAQGRVHGPPPPTTQTPDPPPGG